MPYWLEDDSNRSAKAKLAGVIALTLGTTAVRFAIGPPPLPPGLSALDRADVLAD